MATIALDQFNDAVSRRLYEVLWSWALCPGCSDEKDCTAWNCPSRRIPRLRRYFQYYEGVVSNYLDNSNRTFQTHQDLFDVIEALKANPDMTRSQLSNFITAGGQKNSNNLEAMNEVTLAVMVMFM